MAGGLRSTEKARGQFIPRLNSLQLFCPATLGLLFTAAAGAAAGVLFGLCMAVYYRHSAAKLKLPSWGRYPNA